MLTSHPKRFLLFVFIQIGSDIRYNNKKGYRLGPGEVSEFTYLNSPEGNCLRQTVVKSPGGSY